jgi:hypothetical protein
MKRGERWIILGLDAREIEAQNLAQTAKFDGQTKNLVYASS